jgi:hypothetical protein
VLRLSDPKPLPVPTTPGVAWLGWRDCGEEDDEVEDDTAIDEDD